MPIDRISGLTRDTGKPRTFDDDADSDNAAITTAAWCAPFK